VICANPQMPRNGDQFFPYRQNSDFFYFTGIPYEGGILVISRASETLLLREPDRKTELWSGPMLSRQEASDLSGIRDVRWSHELDPLMEREAQKAELLYLDLPEKKNGEQGPVRGERTPGTQMPELLAGRFPTLERKSFRSMVAALRAVKEPEELDVIRKACGITRSGFLRMLSQVRPGIHEYELEAELTAEIIRKGARGHAFEPIIASGRNALVLHYLENGSRCMKGELLLMDFGAEVQNYASDCTRTVPVDGTFTKRQRQVYEAVYRVFLQARELMVPGLLLNDLQARVGKLLEEEHIALGLYTREEAGSVPEAEAPWKRYFVHGISHSIGLDVHDPYDRSLPVHAGMVLSCEPGIYIPEEGIGIRLENVILVTADGPVDLMEDIPMEAGEIEKLMVGNTGGQP
jgi:Xaa-Pro aminopeptidase